MKLCILGGGLTGLSLAKSLIKKGLSVDIFLNKKNLDFNKNRTIGISNDNLIYFNKEILDIKKLLWDIKKIEIYSDNLRNEKILNFENNNKTLFAIIKNYQLQSKLFTSLKKEKLCKLKNNINYKQYSITNFGTSNFFELKSLNLRTYYHKNILAFGDLLHRLHPLAGQGFNMTIRDIQDLNNLIDLKLKNGLELDSSICEDFQNTTRHKNYLFSSGIDFIYEFFNLETKMNNNIISKSVRLIGKNKFLNRSFKNIANSGFKI